MPSAPTNSAIAARISRPSSSTTCAPDSSRYTCGRQASPLPAWRVISDTTTWACTSTVIGSALDPDEREHAGDHEQSAEPDAGVGLFEVTPDHERRQHEGDRHAHEVGGEHHRHVRLAERE